MAFTITTLSLFRDTRELENIHQLVIAECECVNKLVIGVVNFTQTPKHIVQMFARNPLSHCHAWHFCEVKASALWVVYNGHQVSPLLLGDYGYDATKSREWDGKHFHHIFICSTFSHLFLCSDNGATILQKIALENCVVGWACGFAKTRKCDRVMGGLGIVPKWWCGERASHCWSWKPTSSNAKTFFM